VKNSDLFLHLLLALAAVMALGRLLGGLFRRLGQPAVIGEVVAGILLGPSLMGRLAPAWEGGLLPQVVAPLLGSVAQLGIVLYMFLVGLELNAAQFNGKKRATLAISLSGIVLPLALGLALALWLYPRFSSPEQPQLSFSLFMGVAMSITAFPVLARILGDSGLTKTSLGSVALAAAAVDDVAAWCLLALVVGVANADLGAAAWVALELALFVATMLCLRPLLLKLVTPPIGRPLSQNALALVLLGVLASALATEFIGIHAIFGAFLFGALVPHDSAVARACEAKLKDLVTLLFLPAFFAFTGMRTDIGLLQTWEQWAACALIIAVATLGKFGGVSLAARLGGMGAKDSRALGILMNTRGLVELIALNVGLDMKIISPTLYAMMVLMALITTLATAPALRLFCPGLLPPRR
jgi:Kef-type K+ transport system membrane component KefB